MTGSGRLHAPATAFVDEPGEGAPDFQEQHVAHPLEQRLGDGLEGFMGRETMLGRVLQGIPVRIVAIRWTGFTPAPRPGHVDHHTASALGTPGFVEDDPTAIQHPPHDAVRRADAVLDGAAQPRLGAAPDFPRGSRTILGMNTGEEDVERCARFGQGGIDVEHEGDEGIRIDPVVRNVVFPPSDHIRGIDRLLQHLWRDIRLTHAIRSHTRP